MKIETGRETAEWMMKQQTSEIAYEKTWTWQNKGNLKRETEIYFNSS